MREHDANNYYYDVSPLCIYVFILVIKFMNLFLDPYVAQQVYGNKLLGISTIYDPFLFIVRR